MNSNLIRQQFLDFYAARGHQIIPTLPLLKPPKHPNLMSESVNLWTLPFHPISLGQTYSPDNHSAILQKHISPNITVLTECHPTFFEMLDNWGDYSKQQALTWAWELCTEVYQLPPSRLVVSVCSEDTETIAIWRDKIGIPEHRIIISRWNFWRPHPCGHCGPSTGIHYDFYPERGYELAASFEDIEFQSKDPEYYDRQDILDYLVPENDFRFLSFYRLIFMDSESQPYGNKYTPLPANYIAAGMNIEQLATILQETSSFYETDLIFPIIETAARVAAIDYHQSDKLTKLSLKAIADRVRAAVHLSADYILKPRQDWPHLIHQQIKKWLMCMVLHVQILGIEHSFIELLIDTTITLEETFYPHLQQQQTEITAFLQQQESYCWKLLQSDREKGIITGSLMNQLFHTYDCCMKDINRWAIQHKLTLDWDGYNQILGPEID
jgi:alanyl-tRNA synthetase